ncbi:unnamed protein product [Phytophthora fragariaefolia]|uniref:Unnamed protein product n=1 Tax=Phytophthora fragariaefolia TaxID=1490495 RepID=A0A9W7DBE3_9STRA|nr:unnamed protein product [Phytophthora fragariaefolia]
MSYDTLAARAAPSAIKSDTTYATLTGIDDRRSLRGFSDNAAAEERAPVEVFKKLKAALSNTSISKKLQEIQQKKIAEREAFVKKLLDDKATIETLQQNKVTVEEVYKGYGITAAHILFGNPSLPSHNLVQVRINKRSVERAERIRNLK